VLVFVVQMGRCRSRSRGGSDAFYLDDSEATPARQKCGGKKGKKKKGKGKKHERSRVRQPYIGTCLSIPYLDAKFMR